MYSSSWVWKENKTSKLVKNINKMYFCVSQTFAQMFVNFLEKESSPQPEMRLPTERMVQEELQKHHPHSNKPRLPPPDPASQNSTKFNPFSAPMHATLPLQVPPVGGPSGGYDPDRGGAGGGLELGRSVGPTVQAAQGPTDSHILMNAITAGTLPIFAAPTDGYDGSSANSSGRSTPASSSAILRDVLQQ